MKDKDLKNPGLSSEFVFLDAHREGNFITNIRVESKQEQLDDDTDIEYEIIDDSDTPDTHIVEDEEVRHKITYCKNL